MLDKELYKKAVAMNGIISLARERFAKEILDNAIVPLLKEWTLYVDWAMGSVTFHEPDGYKLRESDPRIKETVDEINTLCRKYSFNENERCEGIWWVLSSIQHEGKTNDQYKPVSYEEPYSSSQNPSTPGRKTRFKDLKKGDSVYIVDYRYGCVDKSVIKKINIDEDSVQIRFLEGEPEVVTVKPNLLRSSNIFTSKEKAQKSLDAIFDMVANYHRFPFRPENPAEYLSKFLIRT